MKGADKVVRCDCGHEVRAGDEAHLVARLQAHAYEAHGIQFSYEDALVVVLRVDLDEPIEKGAST